MFPDARRWITRVMWICALAQLPPGISPLHGKMTEWTEVQGATFRGEPTDIIGPFVVFRTGGGGRRVPLRAFRPEDCRRIHAELAARPPRAERLAQARGEATGDLVGAVEQIRNRALGPADLTDRAEPELLLVLSGSSNSPEGWFMAGNLHQFYVRLKRVYPDLIEGVFLGTRHDTRQHRDMALKAGMPWLVADLHEQGGMSALRRFIPAEGAQAVLVTRQGVPLVGTTAGEFAAVQAFVDQVAELLWQIDPANPAGWPDRLHYAVATRPGEFAQGTAPPLLIGDPLRAEGLRKHGIRRVAARLAVAADGQLKVTMLSGAEDLPPAYAGPLAAALAKAVVAPALAAGRPVAGTLDYRLEVPPAAQAHEAERAWLGSTHHPQLIIPEWLVLRPILVPEKEFDSAIVGQTADGTVILNAMEVNSGRISRAAQMSAFNSNWFDGAGADSVRPRAGERQRIDAATELIWERVRSDNGFVEMQQGPLQDYTVGYAWAEFTLPRDTEALLGLGSDDGVKIWLNGELVHDKWIRRSSRVDDDVVPLSLKAGANRILIKIQNATAHWSFVYRLRLKP